MDTVDILINDEEELPVARAMIEIKYWFIEEDMFDGIGNGFEESVEYNTNEIVIKLKEIADEWVTFISENKKTIENLKTTLCIFLNNTRTVPIMNFGFLTCRSVLEKSPK